MADDLKQKLASLGQLTRPQLVTLWTELKGARPAFRARRDFLARVVAYHLQERAYGGLSKATQRRLKRLAEALEAGETPKYASRPQIKPGTRLIRAWRGDTHEVEVQPRGFGYRGQTYRSLSEIARLITGTRWSGPLFFGLKGKPGGDR